MRFLHRGVEYSLPDDWWMEAGMVGFVATARSFRAGASQWSNLAIFEVAVDDVEPLRRQGSHGVFNDNTDTGSARERVVSILRGFCDGSAIPPVDVTKLTGASTRKFKLIHGAHRFYCSVAAGFSHVPAVEVYDVWGEPEQPER